MSRRSLVMVLAQLATWLVSCAGERAPGPAPSPLPVATAHTAAKPTASAVASSQENGAAVSAAAAATPSTSATPVVPASPETPRRRFAGGGPASVSGARGIVTSSEAQATRAGVQMLERGGNAVDAAVATAFALAVTHASAGNIGGGGFMLVRAPGVAAETIAIDFRETAPAALTRAGFDKMQAGGAKGGAAAGVPGSVAGLLLAHERFGRLKREELLGPAIALAKGGMILGRRQADLLRGSYASVKRDPTLAKRFGDATGPKAQGARVVQPELASALERIQQLGAAGFYEGATAKAITAAPGSLISSDDLKGYRAVVRAPLRSSYRGLQIETMPPPSAGGVAVTEMLALLELLHVEKSQGADELHLFLEVCRRAQAERRFGVSDPDVLTPALRDAALARFLAPQALLDQVPIDLAHATPSSKLAPFYPGALHESEQTTHLGVIDGDGMVVSLTTTLSASFGAKLTAPGTGIVLNNSVASFSRSGENQPAPGKRTTSSMAPTLVLDRGRVVLVLGTPGGDTIPGTIVQVLRNVVDHGMALDAAVAAPRVHQSFLPDRARYESRRPLDPTLLKALKALGHELTGSYLAMGDSNDILVEEELAYGVADPRGGGLAAAVR